jgi:hypothetical protein
LIKKIEKYDEEFSTTQLLELSSFGTPTNQKIAPTEFKWSPVLIVSLIIFLIY